MILQQRTRIQSKPSQAFIQMLVLLFCLVAFPSLSFAQDDSGERYISIQMERVPGAKFYEVEVSPYPTRGLEPGQMFQIYDEEPKVYAKLKPGHYAARARSLGMDGKPGEWGAWNDFQVQPKKIEVLYPAEAETIIPKSPDKEKIVFHWPQTLGATSYSFTLQQNGKTIDAQKVNNNWAEATIQPEQSYSWTVIPEIAGSEPQTHDFSVGKPSLNGKTVIIDVEGDPAAQLYQYELVKFSADNKPLPPSIFEQKEARFKMKLPPGLYELRVRSLLLNQSVSDWSKPQRFYIRFPYPNLIAPKDGLEFDPLDNWHNQLELQWQPIEGANKYLVRVLDKVTKNIVAVKEVREPSVTIEVEHEHSYQWSVIALSYGEKPETEALKTAPQWEFTIPPYIKLQLSNPEESSHFYGWYRHWISMIHYVGKNYDQNSLYDQKIFGGTGEFALGWWNRKSKWGYLVDGSLSGFEIDSQLYNYSTIGLNVGRRVFIGDFSRLRYWFGLSYSEYPDFVVSPYDATQVSYTRVPTWGPQAQISYLNELSDEYGYHLYFQTYFPAAALKTPNGNTFHPGISLRFGLLGTWNYTEDIKVMAGYSYRYDMYGYTSRSYLGARNSSEFGGHFLNLAVEFGLSKQKFK